MKYRGGNYAFGVSSLSVAASEAVSIYATGRVVQLTKIAGFGGRYLASGAQSAAAGGGLATHLHNERGAVMQLVAMVAATTASRSGAMVALWRRARVHDAGVQAPTGTHQGAGQRPADICKRRETLVCA